MKVEAYLVALPDVRVLHLEGEKEAPLFPQPRPRVDLVAPAGLPQAPFVHAECCPARRRTHGRSHLGGDKPVTPESRVPHTAILLSVRRSGDEQNEGL